MLAIGRSRYPPLNPPVTFTYSLYLYFFLLIYYVVVVFLRTIGTRVICNWQIVEFKSRKMVLYCFSGCLKFTKISVGTCHLLFLVITLEMFKRICIQTSHSILPIIVILSELKLIFHNQRGKCGKCRNLPKKWKM